MAYEIEVSDEANTEADEAYEWIARQSPEHAVKWYQGLFAAIQSLAENPERCPLAPESPCSRKRLL